MNTTPESAEDNIDIDIDAAEAYAGEQAAEPSSDDTAAMDDDGVVAASDNAPRDASDGTAEADLQDAPLDEAAEIDVLRAELADTKDKMLRALAETENVRRRAQRDKEEASKYAVTSFARDVIAVADNFRRAIESVDAPTRESSDAIRNMIVGIEMTEREMLGTFERFGIKRIAAEGVRFDSNLHEAMFELEDLEKPAGTVVQVLETGYMLHDRLLRPAKVGVSKGGPKAPPPDAAPAGDGPEDAAAKSGQQAYEKQGDPGAGAKVDQEL